MIKRNLLFVPIILLFILLSSSFFSVGSEDSSLEDIVGLWRADTVIYDGKKRFSLSDKDLFYRFDADGTGSITLDGSLISRFRWFIRDSSLYVDKPSNVFESDSSHDASGLSSGLSGAVVVRNKSLVESMFGDIDSYFFGLLRTGRAKDFFSLVLLERVIPVTEKNSYYVELERAMMKHKYYNYALHMPLFDYHWFSSWEHNSRFVFRSLLGRRVIMNKVEEILVSKAVVKPVKPVKKLRKPKKRSPVKKKVEIRDLDKPLLLLKERSKSFEIINESE